MQNSQNCSESSDSNRGAYLEIYKLQIDTITKISDRRVNVSRYYIFAISALILALSVVSSSDFLEGLRSPIIRSSENSENSENSKDASENTKNILFVMGVAGLLGFVLTFSWVLNMLGYLISNTKRYEKIKDLEARLPYQFTESMWRSTSKGNTHEGNSPEKNTKKYFDFAAHELITPFLFCMTFTMLSLYGFFRFFFGDNPNLRGILVAGCFVLVVLFGIIYSKERKNVQR